MKLELRHLQLLDAVARSGSIHSAARELGVERTTVSRQLARLEAALGGALVSRTARGVTLTSRGALALERVRRILQELDGLRDLAAVPAVATPVIRLAGSMLGEAASRWRHEGHVVVTTAASPPESYRLLEQGLVDLVVAYEDPSEPTSTPPPGLPVSRRRVPLRAALSVDHPLAGSTLLTLSELARVPWLLESDSAVQAVTMSACEAAGFCPVPLLVGDAGAVLSAVRAGAGVTLLPPSYLSPGQRSVVLVPVEPAVWLWEVCVGQAAVDLPGAGRHPDRDLGARLPRSQEATPAAVVE